MSVGIHRRTSGTYLRQLYNLGIRYVLLGGDTDSIPAKMLYVEGMDENVTPYDTDDASGSVLRVS